MSSVQTVSFTLPTVSPVSSIEILCHLVCCCIPAVSFKPDLSFVLFSWSLLCHVLRMAHLMSSWQYSCHLMSSDSPLLVMVINFTHFLVCLLCILISITLTTWHVIWCQDSYTPVAVLCCHDSSITSQFIKISSSCHLLSLWHPCPCYLMASHLYPCHMSSWQLYPSCHYHHDSSLFSSDVTMTTVPIVIRCHMSADHIVWCHHDNCPSCCLVSP